MGPESRLEWSKSKSGHCVRLQSDQPTDSFESLTTANSPNPFHVHHRLLCVRAGLVSWPPQSAIVKVLRHESVQQDLLALNDLARMGLLSEGELQWDDIEEAVGDTGGALVLGWASRRRRLKARREQAPAPAEG